MVSLWPKPTPASYSNPLDPRFRAYGVRPQSPFHTNHPLQPDALEPAPLLTLGKDSRFWMARPRLGLNGVSGLETLKAGNYIAVEFGAGKSTRCFTGLGHAPKIRAETPGRSYLLVADNAGSLQEGTPICFRNIQAGRVVNVQLAADEQSVLTKILIVNRLI